VVDELGEQVPAGVAGELQLDGWNKMVGYYKVSNSDQPFTHDGWVRTGDRGRIDEHGYIEFLGRAKDVIRSGGENVASFEIEHYLESFADVLQAAVIAVPHERFGETPFAFVRLRPGSSVTEEQLGQFCEAGLADFKRPRYYAFVDEFPLVGINKVSKLKLRSTAIALLEDIRVEESTRRGE
jgi:fatty-acyl-CoA synthase